MNSTLRHLLRQFLRLSAICCISCPLLLLIGCGGSGSEEDHFVFDNDDQTIATNPNPPDSNPSDPADPSNPNDPIAKSPSPGAGSGEHFVWKPISEADGNAVVLLPATSSARELLLFGPFGRENGIYQGRTNGGRPTFRFNLPGCAYAPVAQTETQEGDNYFIESPCNRLEF